MNGCILRSTSFEAGTARSSAGGTITADALGGLVSVGLATTEAKHFMDRHLHEWLVGHGLGRADIRSEGEDRQSGNRFGQHLGFVENGYLEIGLMVLLEG